MNILYICHYAGSPKYGMEFRPYYMAREWLKLGHNVLIVGASYSHLRTEQPVCKKKCYESIDNVDFCWYEAHPYSYNGISRAKNIFKFLWRLYIDSLKLVKEFRPDIVIASSTYPFDIWPARHIVKKSGAKLIYEIHDLWPLSPIELGGMSPKHPFIRLCQKAENDCYKYSDAVVSILPNVHEHITEHGGDVKKLYIVPNGIVREDWAEENIEKLSDKKILNFFEEQKRAGNFLVGYTGAHGKPNALEYLLKAAKLLENKPISFVLVGSGIGKNNLIEFSKKLNLKNIFYFDPISKKKIPALLNYFDIAYIGGQNIDIYKFGISPNKLMDYMMAKKVILHSYRCKKNIVSESGCGLTVEPENPQSIADGILKLVSLSEEERIEMGKKGREYILKNQTYDILAKKFLSAMI